MSRLVQIVAFANVGSGNQALQAHQINVNGTPTIPDFVAVDSDAFQIVSVTATEVTVENVSDDTASCNVWLQHLHSIPRQVASASLSPSPFVVASGGGVGGGAVAATSQISVDVVDASGVTGTLGNGVTYIPFVKDAADTIQFQVRIPQTGDFTISLAYYMSAGDVGDVQLRLDSVLISDGDDPTAALVVGTPFTFTPGNDTNRHTLDDGVAAELGFSATEGDTAVFEFTRVAGAPDTHPGDVRVLEIAVLAV